MENPIKDRILTN